MSYTEQEREEIVNQKGNILTFTEEYKHNGNARGQIIVDELQWDGRAVMIKGLNGINSQSFDTLDCLIDALDWAWMDNVDFKTREY